MTQRERFKQLGSYIIERKEAFDNFVQFLWNETDFFHAPASTRFHLCREEGLLEHCCNVAENVLKFRQAMAPDISEESCVLCALFHDLGKAGMPGMPQYLKNEPTERQKQYGYGPTIPYRFNENLTYLSVPIRSLYLLLPHIPLTEEEAQAIAYHDGQYVDDNRSVATKESKLTLLLQYADTWSSFVTEKENEKEN